jgi:hypothetical protein
VLDIKKGYDACFTIVVSSVCYWAGFDVFGR